MGIITGNCMIEQLSKSMDCFKNYLKFIQQSVQHRLYDFQLQSVTNIIRVNDLHLDMRSIDSEWHCLAPVKDIDKNIIYAKL